MAKTKDDSLSLQEMIALIEKADKWIVKNSDSMVKKTKTTSEKYIGFIDNIAIVLQYTSITRPVFNIPGLSFSFLSKETSHETYISVKANSQLFGEATIKENDTKYEEFQSMKKLVFRKAGSYITSDQFSKDLTASVEIPVMTYAKNLSIIKGMIYPN